MVRTTLGAIALLTALAVAVAGCSKKEGDAKAETLEQRRAEASVQTSSSSMAPDFNLRDTRGKYHKLSSYRDKVIILNFWDTWCPPCKAEIPDFVELQKRYKDKGLQIIGIALARQGLDAVKSFMKKYKINYPILLADAKVIQDYGGLQGIPTTFLIDRKGQIFRKYVGYRPREVWERDIKTLFRSE